MASSAWKLQQTILTHGSRRLYNLLHVRSLDSYDTILDLEPLDVLEWSGAGKTTCKDLQKLQEHLRELPRSEFVSDEAPQHAQSTDSLTASAVVLGGMGSHFEETAATGPSIMEEEDLAALILKHGNLRLLNVLKVAKQLTPPAILALTPEEFMGLRNGGRKSLVGLRRVQEELGG